MSPEKYESRPNALRKSAAQRHYGYNRKVNLVNYVNPGTPRPEVRTILPPIPQFERTLSLVILG